MKFKKRKKEKFFGQKMTVSILLTVILSCTSVQSEISPNFSYINYNNSEPVKLINPLYLDSSKSEKPVIKVNTIQATSFSEEDYFSSSIDNPPQPTVSPQ